MGGSQHLFLESLVSMRIHERPSSPEFCRLHGCTKEATAGQLLSPHNQLG